MRRKQKRSQLKNFINLFEIISLLFIFTLFYYIDTPISTKKNIYIPSNSDIIAHLQKKGFDVGVIDRLILKLFQEPKPGWVYIGKNNLPRLEFLNIIGSKKGRYKTIKLIPGETTEIFLAQLAKELDLNQTKLKEEFLRQSRYKEAGIIADSYNIPLDFKEKKVINYLVNITDKKYSSLAKKYSLPYPSKEWEKILIVASIIQKEAANKKEMPLVGSVIYNRLKKRMRLQMDGTLNYGKYSHIKVTPKRIKEDNSTYNTYKHRGLPKYPVCNVSISAITAAINPAKTNYLYFVKSGKAHTFSSTYKKHIKNIKKRKEELKKVKQ